MNHTNSNQSTLQKILSSIGEISRQLWVISIFVTLMGILLIIASKTHSSIGSHLGEELARDIGIAFIVAVVVTIVYEAGTRRSAQIEEMSDYINTTMGSMMPKEVWEEVRRQVILRDAIRRNVNIKIKYLPSLKRADGTMEPLFENEAVLWVEYSYDLYSLMGSGRKVEVRHVLDYHMRREELTVPRFVSARVVGPGLIDKHYGEGGTDLNIITDEENKGMIIIPIPMLSTERPVKVVSSRYEVVNVPGMYTIMMSEMLTYEPRAGSQRAVSLTVSVEDLPLDIEAGATTWFAPHELRREAGTNVWTYSGPMLAGQGFSVTFKRIPASIAGAKATLGVPVTTEAQPAEEAAVTPVVEHPPAQLATEGDGNRDAEMKEETKAKEAPEAKETPEVK